LKQPRCPSGGKLISKQWYIQTIEYYSVLERNALSNQEKTWRNRKCTLLIGKGHMLYNSNYLTFCKRQNYGASKKTSGCHWLRAEG
jgi:hypothetical protein